MAKEKNKTRNLGGGRRASGAAGSYKAKNYLFAIAINDYEHIDKLHNCVRDAEAVIELLTEDFEFEREEVCFICSGPLKPDLEDVAILEETNGGSVRPAKATRSVILKQLRRIARSIEKDQQEDPELKVNLLLYYSGHGWYDDFLDQGYWIPVDSELDDYSKYISNSTIRDFLSGINTHHTLLLSDSCFSGSLFASGTGKSLASTRLEKDPSRWGITAGRNEVVSDGEAGKQSPFIESFLTELRAADTISVQDLSTKILERVASNDKQTPRGEPLRVRGHKGGQFVFRKKANARKHFEAGQLILQLARHQPEYARFRAAGSQFEMAGRLSKKPEDQLMYTFWEARALGYAGLYPAAIESLKKRINTFRDHQKIAPLRALKEALHWLHAPTPPSGKLFKDTFSTTGNWTAELSAIYDEKHQEEKNCHLVQVAINEYQDPSIPELRGSINDAKLVGKSLTKLFGPQRFNTEQLFNEDATKANIVQTLASLQNKVRKEDFVFIHFSGHAISSQDEGKGNLPFIVTFDTSLNDSPQKRQMINHRDLHELMEAIPTENKVLIMDTDTNDAFQELAKTGSYTLLLAADKGQKSHEIIVENKQTHGIFSYAFARVLAENHQSTAAQKPLVINEIIAEKVKKQTPVFVRAEGLFRTISYLSIDAEALIMHLMQTFFGARNVNLSTNTTELIHAIKLLGLTFSAEEWEQLAEQLSVSKEIGTKINFYEKSLALYQAKTPAVPHSELLRVELQLASLYLRVSRLGQAEKYLTAAYGHLSDKDSSRRAFISQKLSELKRLAKRKKYALLVGLSRGENQAAQAKGVEQDLESWLKTLLELGYAAEHITILKGHQATRAEILKQFGRLAKKAATNPAFFFCAGEKLVENEQQGDSGLKTAQGTHAENKPRPLLPELAALSQKTKHLTVVLDGDFNKANAFTSEAGLPTMVSGQPVLGNTLLLPGVLEKVTRQTVHQYHETKEQHRGALSTLLSLRLQQGGKRIFTELDTPDLEPLVLLAGNWLP